MKQPDELPDVAALMSRNKLTGEATLVKNYKNLRDCERLAMYYNARKLVPEVFFFVKRLEDE